MAIYSSEGGNAFFTDAEYFAIYFYPTGLHVMFLQISKLQLLWDDYL